MNNAEGPSASGLLVLGLTTALGGVGFLDDFIKIRKQRNLGLNKTAKLVGQFVAAIAFGILALQFRGDDGLTPGSVHLSYVRDIATVSLGSVVFIAFCYLLVSAWSNAVNLTDGLDGLAAGAMSFVLGAYVIITFWQFRYSCETNPGKGCYDVRDALDLAVLCAAGAGACIGFLWWNAAPAKIFMGDTGSLALGGMLAGLSITTSTELLMVVIGALFVAEAASVVIQVAVFRSSRRRVFRMAPFHHHFELAGWAETTVIIRFWLLAAIALKTMTSSADSENDLSWLRGTRVLVAGGRVSGQATIEPLVALGAVVTVADSTLDFAERCAELGADMVTTTSIEDAPDSITEYGLVVTSPGFRPDAPILAAAA
eukprot:gene30158-37242_t